ncbi:CYTH domain-containing protein [Gracilibacillus sp. S3-1-1]|uniref:CYTH domain-containing protein n=1 Tax=Gracilibacillus pellucidus TaxID=3095368 RepID=A0ACC6M4I9_9BACI|nr:CYTH domain-containing protein [Gracilibacillus sp. S3-1-1]MDX8045800.1 CYTH domain-containing protein [Gracilibacillus sp. S3-1-1]
MIKIKQEIEIEFKNLLTEEEYQQLINHFSSSNQQIIHQKNHYFDTFDFQLKTHKSALRIREKKDQFQLTLKQPNPNGPGLLETHCTITEKEAKQFINGTIIDKAPITHALTKVNIPIDQLRYGGALETYRIEHDYQQTTLVLDKSHYNNHIDYELELEASSEEHGTEVFNTLLEQWAIPKRKTPNKIERFYHTIK